MKILIAAFLVSISASAAEDWPRWRGEKADGRWNPAGIPADFSRKEPERLWKAEIGAGFGGVTVSDGLVYVMDRQQMPQEVERLPLNASVIEILGVKIAKVTIPVAPGRNLAVLVEAAVRNTVLQLRGIDSNRELAERQAKMIAGSE